MPIELVNCGPDILIGEIMKKLLMCAAIGLLSSGAQAATDDFVVSAYRTSVFGV